MRMQSSGSQEKKVFQDEGQSPITEAETLTQSSPQEASLGWIGISSGCQARQGQTKETEARQVAPEVLL